MTDYSYQEMLKMQQEAADRVREMKKRASLAVEEENADKHIAPPQEVKRISYPVELPQDDRIKEPKEEEKTNGGFLKLITEDKDALLILAVLAVISQNSEDNVTSLALLYLLL